jgi:hypothetical protein
VGLSLLSGSALAALAVPLLVHGFRDWLRWLTSVLDAGGADPAPIRKEVRSGCRDKHLMNTTPSRRSWASAS